MTDHQKGDCACKGQITKGEHGPLARPCPKCERTDCGGAKKGCPICGECERRVAGAAHGPGLCGDTNACGLCGNFLMQADGTIGSHGRGLCVSIDRNGRVTSRRKKDPRALKCARTGCRKTTDKNPVPGTAWMCAEHDAAEKARVAKETQ